MLVADLGDGGALHLDGEGVGDCGKDGAALGWGGDELVAADDEAGVDGSVGVELMQGRAGGDGGVIDAGGRGGDACQAKQRDLVLWEEGAGVEIVLEGFGCDDNVADGDGGGEASGDTGEDDLGGVVVVDEARGRGGGGDLADAGHDEDDVSACDGASVILAVAAGVGDGWDVAVAPDGGDEGGDLSGHGGDDADGAGGLGCHEASREGFEPPTGGLEVRCSIQLSYRDVRGDDSVGGMMWTRKGVVVVSALLVVLGCCCGTALAQPGCVRVGTFNVEDLRLAEIEADTPATRTRVDEIVRVIRDVNADVLLVNEIEYAEDMAAARALAKRLPGYTVHAWPSNTGIASGHDLDNDGTAHGTPPTLPAMNEDGTPGRATDAGRAYGNDAFGFGTYPGQYAMALLVRDGLEVQADGVRTFQTLHWSAMPDAMRPMNEDGTPWHSDEARAAMRLSSKSHWDVPVKLGDGSVVHVLASHPTPPAFDGAEQRNKKRNHDEIRFWGAYIEGGDAAEWIVDDAGKSGGLDAEAHFVIVGDLNADPRGGSSIGDPIGTWLTGHERVRALEPTSRRAMDGLDPWDTAMFRLRVDYALPSTSLGVRGMGMARPGADGNWPSDHFPVWVDVCVP